MTKCWHASADKRPTMEDVISFLDTQVGDDDAETFSSGVMV
jgi:hypothetical protein